MKVLFPALFIKLLLVSLVAGGPEEYYLEEGCEHPKYEVNIYSYSPLVIYIANFLSPEEQIHLQNIGKETFMHPDEDGPPDDTQLEEKRPSPQLANLKNDAVVRCISERARLFQGLDIPPSHLEPLQLVQYTTNQSSPHQVDWLKSPSDVAVKHGGNRASSFFVYVARDKSSGGGLNFPRLNSKADDVWCWYLHCDEEWDKGATFRAHPGNAVFWRNIDDQREGNERLLRGTPPLTSGKLLTMNIWTREGPISQRSVTQPEYCS